MSFDEPRRGWLRRLAPLGWHDGAVVGSLEGAEATAWLTLLVGLVRMCGAEWLTPVDVLVAAENKLLQYRCAASLGLAVPETVVASDAESLRGLGDEVVLKPLGPGHFVSPEGPTAVFATAVRLSLIHI